MRPRPREPRTMRQRGTLGFSSFTISGPGCPLRVCASTRRGRCACVGESLTPLIELLPHSIRHHASEHDEARGRSATVIKVSGPRSARASSNCILERTARRVSRRCRRGCSGTRSHSNRPRIHNTTRQQRCPSLRATCGWRTQARGGRVELRRHRMDFAREIHIC